MSGADGRRRTLSYNHLAAATDYQRILIKLVRLHPELTWTPEEHAAISKACSPWIFSA